MYSSLHHLCLYYLTFGVFDAQTICVTIFLGNLSISRNLYHLIIFAVTVHFILLIAPFSSHCRFYIVGIHVPQLYIFINVQTLLVD